MKRMTNILCVIVLLLGLTACNEGAQKESVQEPQENQQQEPVQEAQTPIKKEEQTAEYRLTAGALQEITDQNFTSEITIYVDANSTADKRSEINFSRCTFQKGLRIVGDRSAWIRLLDDCSFENNSGVVAVEATVGNTKSATLEDDFIKLFVGVPDVKIETTTLLNSISSQNFIMNGVNYQVSDFPDSNIFCAAYYYENGAPAVYTEGWTE